MNTLHAKPIASLVLGLVMGLLVGTPGVASAYGEGTELLPSWEERAVHLFTDRLRVEPAADDPQFSDYSAVRPLVYNPDLNEAARFYADDMAENGCFPADHSSCDGTSFGERLNNFYAGQMIGENIALGSPTAEAVVVDGWLYSPPHRENMLSGQWLELGTGHGQADSGQRYWVQDFGSRGLVEEPITTSGIHWPLRTDPDEDVTFFLAVYDPDGDPDGAELVLDGDCEPMPLDRGVPNQGTYALTATTDEGGCVPYYFVLTRSDGAKVTYPTEGVFLLPVGEQDCPSWLEHRDSQECNPEDERPAFEAEGSGCGATDLEGGGPDSNVGDSTTYATCGTAGRVKAHAWLVLLVALQGVLRRRAARHVHGSTD